MRMGDMQTMTLVIAASVLVSPIYKPGLDRHCISSDRQPFPAQLWYVLLVNKCLSNLYAMLIHSMPGCGARQKFSVQEPN